MIILVMDGVVVQWWQSLDMLAQRGQVIGGGSCNRVSR